jgi:hypothetical protein
MVGRAVTNRAERRSPGSSMLPARERAGVERLAPAAPIAELVAQIEAWTRPGEVVLDLNGRGGWVARAAMAGQRRAADLESLSLTRLLADVVLRPPDLRHLDAAAQAISIRRLGDTTVRQAIEELFTSTCPTCGRPIVLDSLVWEGGVKGRATPGAAPNSAPGAELGSAPGAAPNSAPGAASGTTPAGTAPAGAAPDRPVQREYRCPRCQGQQGGPELRHAPPIESDLTAAAFDGLPEEDRETLRKRFPGPRPDHPLADQLLDLHTARQLVGLHAILQGIELETRAAPLTAALRFAFMHAVASAGRLNAYRGTPPVLRISNGNARLVGGRAWRERNPWLAFEDGLAAMRTFVDQLASDEKRSVAARFATDLVELQEGTPNVILGEATPGSLRRIGVAGDRISHSGTPSRIRLVLGQAPIGMSHRWLVEAYHETAWALGAGAVTLLPYEALFRPEPRSAGRGAAEELARSLGRSLAIASPALATNGRAVILLDDAEPRTLVAAAIGGAAAGCRLVEARLHRGSEESAAVAAFVPPTGVLAPGPRTRANRPLPPVEGGAGDPGTIAGQGVLAAPEKLNEGPFRAPAAAMAVNDTATALLKARGEPARFEDILGGLLVGLDRSGQLARFARQFRPPRADQGWDAWVDPADEPSAGPQASAGPATAARAGAQTTGSQAAAPGHARVSGAETTVDEPPDAGGPIDDLLALIRGELDRSTNRRVRQVEPGYYWLAGEEDRSGAAQPLADRVEWAVFSLLSSSRQMAESAVMERTNGLFTDSDTPDEGLLRACLESYSGPGSTPDAIVTADQLERRSAQHDAMIALIADLGHRLGTRVWIGRRQQVRRIDGRPLGDRLDAEERAIQPSSIAWGPEAELERVDCAWYVRRKATFLFEVEWTAMLGDPVLVRHSRFPSDDKVVRFLVIPPERAALVRHKLERSPLLRGAFAERNWHILKWDQLAVFAGREEVSLADLQPYLGLDADVAPGEQLPLFEG